MAERNDEKLKIGKRMMPKQSKDELQRATAKAREGARNGIFPLFPDISLKDRMKHQATGMAKFGAGLFAHLPQRSSSRGAEVPAVKNGGGEGKVMTPQEHLNEARSQFDQLMESEKKSSAPFNKEGILQGDEKTGRVEYSVPGVKGSLVADNLPSSRVSELLDKDRGTLTNLRRPTKSGGDFYGGVDVSQMTPQEYLKFKIDSMNRATEAYKEINAMKAGQETGGKRRRLTPDVSTQGLLSRFERRKLLNNWKKEIDSVTSELERSGTPLRGRQEKLRQLNDYYQAALGLSPQAEEKGKTLRAQMSRDAGLEGEELRQAGQTERTRLGQLVPRKQPQSSFKLKKLPYGPNGLNELPVQVDERTGQVKYPELVQRAKSAYEEMIAKGVTPEEAQAEFQRLLPETYKDLTPGDLL